MKINITWCCIPQVLLAIGLLMAGPFDDVAEGLSHLQAGRLQAAEASFRRSLLLQPRSARLWKLLGMSLSGQEKLSGAETAFSKACGLDRSEDLACYYLGRARTTMGQFRGAHEAFDRAPSSPRLLHGRGLLAHAEGDAVSAESLYRKAMEGGERTAAADLALLIGGQGRIAEAQALIPSIADAPTQERLRKNLASSLSTETQPSPVILQPQFIRQDLSFTLQNGAKGLKRLPETMLGGTAVFDFDNDGRPDLFLSNGKGRSALYRNLGDRKFADVSKEMELPALTDAMGVSAADFDNDGFIDLLVTSRNGPRLFRNESGRRFADFTGQSGLDAKSGWSVAAAAFDYDRDGWLDLFLVRYVQYDPSSEPRCHDAKNNPVYCHPSRYQAQSNVLYRNEHGKFRDVGREAGIAQHFGKGMGVAVGDANGDGWLDVFVANDTMPNFLFLNDAKGGFSESAMAFGVALRDDGKPVSSMGADFRDFDNDGWEDLVITTLTDESFVLFRNLGGKGFADVRLTMRSIAATMPFAGWSVGLFDFNNDGFKDIFTANGHVQDNLELSSSRHSRQENLILLNHAGRFFSPINLPGAGLHRGASFGDLDGDGRIDIVVTALNSSAFVLWNETPRQNWISFSGPLGTRVTLEANGLTQTNRLSTSMGYGASSQPLIHFGLGEATFIQKLTVQFPGASPNNVPLWKINQINALQR